ncbi:hypothetical protein ACEQPO_02365 [Bacillus sp. SL00103]
MTTVKDASEQDALAAYVITDNETEDLKESLKRTLPDYMVPSMDHQARPPADDGKWQSRSKSIASTKYGSEPNSIRSAKR